MADSRDGTDEPSISARELAVICLVAAVAGALIGFVGGAFRWCLERADAARIDLLSWAHELPGPGWLIPMGVTAVCATVAALIVRWVPFASGSGIQHVEAVARGEVDPPQFRILPATLVGGLFSIGSGLVLGREGPIVHMGAVAGAETARRAGMDDDHQRLLQTSVSGAGLAVAFNAPIGGALFVFEEVLHSFRLRTVVPVLVSVAVGVACSRLIVGDAPDFSVGPVDPPSITLLPVFVVFGLLTGVLGAAYNRAVMGSLDVADALRSVPPLVKAAAIGGAIGLLSAASPPATGGGDSLVQHVLSGGALAIPLVALYAALRFATGPVSYAAGTPGGLFAPLLALGALWGVLYAGICHAIVPGIDSSVAVPMAIVGMASLFSAAVRAPITGAVLVMEMTATTSVAVPMLVGVGGAFAIAQLMGSPPIYDSLRERMLEQLAHRPRDN